MRTRMKMQDKNRKRRYLIEIGNENMSLWHKHGDNFSTVKVHDKVGICRTLHIIFFIFLCLYFFNSFFDLRFHLSLAVTFQLLYFYVILNLIYFDFPYLFKFNLIIKAKFYDEIFFCTRSCTWQYSTCSPASTKESASRSFLKIFFLTLFYDSPRWYCMAIKNTKK